MGKIVKYCNSCDEGFAEKFTFCPDCGQSLEAFELNPLASAAPPAEQYTAPAETETVERFVAPAEAAAVIVEKACEILQQRAAGNRLEALLRRAES